MRLNRRDFLKFSMAGVGTLVLPLGSATGEVEDPRFFLQIYVYGGIDSLFLFDGRPLAMTAAGHIHDYVKQEALPWVGANGAQTLATSFARELDKHRHRFSVLNGVFSTTAFDGHLQNVNFLYTGNPFGGESFVPHLNERNDPSYVKRPLDSVQDGGFALDLTNGANSITLGGDSAFNMSEAMKAAPPFDPKHPVASFMNSRLAALGAAGTGRFSAGTRAMMEAYAKAPDLARRLQRLDPKSTKQEPDGDRRFIDLMAGVFREGICSNAILEIAPKRFGLDVHAASMARNQIEIYTDVVGRVRKLFDLLAETPFDATRSLFDVTTVMFASEFGRTLRQPGLPLGDTGTDHNSLNNSILIGGKGVRGGLVIGETDWRTPTETLSGAHKQLDPAGIKLMGKPFDFNTGRARADLPKTFEADDYLHTASVINTVYSLFSVPQSKWRTVKRDGPKAPVIRQLLA